MRHLKSLRELLHEFRVLSLEIRGVETAIDFPSIFWVELFRSVAIPWKFTCEIKYWLNLRQYLRCSSFLFFFSKAFRHGPLAININYWLFGIFRPEFKKGNTGRSASGGEYFKLQCVPSIIPIIRSVLQNLSIGRRSIIYRYSNIQTAGQTYVS